MNRLFGKDQIEFMQVNKAFNKELCRKYGAHRFPSFYYVKPNTRGKVAQKFHGDRSYEELYSWMRALVKNHGGIPIAEEEPEVQWYNEDGEEAGIIDDALGGDVNDHEHDNHQIHTEIVSIQDATTGESLNFSIGSSASNNIDST
jgi:hypothetical protein